MAEQTVDRGGKRGRYYDPPTFIRAVEGLEHERLSDWADAYIGTAEVLEAAGILAHEALPRCARPAKHIRDIPGPRGRPRRG